MRIRRNICGLITCILGLSLILPLLFPLFISTHSGMREPLEHKMFDSFDGFHTRYLASNGTFQPAFSNMTSVLCIIALVLYALFIIFFILQLTKNSRISVRAILRAISITMVLVAVFAFVCSLTFILMNKLTFSNRVLISFKYGIGTYALIFGTLLTGVMGIISTPKYRRSY